MLNFWLLAVLVMALVTPPILLLNYENRMTWLSRYLLSVFPAIYTWGGWRLAVVTYDFLGCRGGVKNVHACIASGLDVTPLVGHGFFLMIPSLLVATPISLWLLLNTSVKQIGSGGVK